MFAIIITDYKTMEDTFRYIGSLNYSDTELKYIVVDNSCNNDGITYIKENNILYTTMEEKNYGKLYRVEYGSKEVLLLEASYNKGYAGGNNLGIRLCTEYYHSVKYAILSNNDIVIDNFDLSNIVNVFRDNPNIGIIGPKVVDTTGKNIGPYKILPILKQGMIDFNAIVLGGKLKKLLGTNVESEKNKSYVTGWVSGCFMVARMDVLKKVNGFDEDVFLYSEEVMLSERFRNQGFVTYYLCEEKVLHNHEELRNDKSVEKVLPNVRMLNEAAIHYYSEYTDTSKINVTIFRLLFKLILLLLRVKFLLKRLWRK